VTHATLVLFDIDGTLLTSASAGRAAIQAAFAEEFDDLAFFERVRFDGKTDPQIVTELHEAAGRPLDATPERIEAILGRYVQHLERELAARAGRVEPLPGILALLAALEARPDVCLGLLTGNVVRGAQLKLGASGIAFERFRLGAFGSDHAVRAHLPAIAAARAEAVMGHRPDGGRVVIIGDTPADVTCGAAIGARAIGVATGWYSRQELLDAGAHAAFDRFDDLDAAIAAIAPAPSTSQVGAA
jgi:phosphoglycolate phosphatase-like HAD superfamily hydrolase